MKRSHNLRQKKNKKASLLFLFSSHYAIHKKKKIEKWVATFQGFKSSFPTCFDTEYCVIVE